MSTPSKLILPAFGSLTGGLDAHHPEIVRAVGPGAQALIPGHDPGAAFFAPMSYGRVRMAAPLPAAVFSHVRLRAGAGDDAALADATLDRTAAVLGLHR